MPIVTVKSSSFADAIDDLAPGSDSSRRRSIARRRMVMPDQAFAAVPPGRC
jgi:hypothetical protein